MRQLTEEQILAEKNLDAKRAAEQTHRSEMGAELQGLERALRSAEADESKTENVRFTDEALARRESAKAIVRMARKALIEAKQRYIDETGLPSPV